MTVIKKDKVTQIKKRNQTQHHQNNNSYNELLFRYEIS